MKVFRCLAYFRSTETGCDKFEERGRPKIFLGYPLGSKGYKLLDLKNKKIIVSLDVKFIETFFPYEKGLTENKEQENFKLPSWHEEKRHHESQSNNQENNQSIEREDVHGVLPEQIKENGGDMGTPDLSMQNEESGGDMETHDFSIQNEVNNGEIVTCEEMIQTMGVNAQIPIRERRNKTRPTYLKGYIVDLPLSIDHASPVTHQSSSTVHSIANYISYKKFTN